MRKSYVSIGDMGTERQNPQREDYYVSSPMHATAAQHSNWSSAHAGGYAGGEHASAEEGYTAPVYTKGRTAMSDVEARPVPKTPAPMRDGAPPARSPLLPGSDGMPPRGGPVQWVEEIHPREAGWARPSAHLGACPDVAAHIAQCPLCSRLYSTSDNAALVYIAVIAVLVAVIVGMFATRRA